MPRNIPLRSSRSFALLIALASAIALCAIWATNLAVWLQLVLTVLVVASLYYHTERHVLLHSRAAWQSFYWSKGGLVVVTRTGEELQAEVLPGTVVTAYFVLIRARVGQRGVVSQLIFRDALGEDEFRELRVRLRFG